MSIITKKHIIHKYKSKKNDSKKVIYSCFKTTISGIYVPEFFNVLNDCSNLGCKEDFVYNLSHKPVISLFENYNKSIIYLLTYFSIFIGIIVIFFTTEFIG